MRSFSWVRHNFDDLLGDFRTGPTSNYSTMRCIVRSWRNACSCRRTPSTLRCEAMLVECDHEGCWNVIHDLRKTPTTFFTAWADWRQILRGVLGMFLHHCGWCFALPGLAPHHSCDARATAKCIVAVCRTRSRSLELTLRLPQRVLLKTPQVRARLELELGHSGCGAHGLGHWRQCLAGDSRRTTYSVIGSRFGRGSSPRIWSLEQVPCRLELCIVGDSRCGCQVSITQGPPNGHSGRQQPP